MKKINQNFPLENTVNKNNNSKYNNKKFEMLL